MKTKAKIYLQNEIIDNLLDRIIALEKASRASYARASNLWDSISGTDVDVADLVNQRQQLRYEVRALEEKVERLSRNWED